MRFFTPSWHRGDLSDAEWIAVVEAYEQHLDELLPRLPLAAQVLARGVNVHDALIRRVVHDTEKLELLMELRCGDLQVGYYDLDLRLTGARIDTPDAGQLSDAADDPQTEVLHTEVDREDEMPTYRILFRPYRECSIRFHNAEIKLTPQPARNVQSAERRFLLIGLPAS